ncbi:hypothetical protein U9M48_006620 [Paspalum notatum var. saurae]|uniref:F-box domain-containing protein n=1 Tax=Paspalum notatum var. saurae TaxID=547442 RepID=A0AAQ3PUS3_PASNO
MDAAAAAGVDRISELPDDLLHVILGFLHDATAASRTAVLSRRWRRVWIHAQGLSFSETQVRCPYYGPCRLAGFMDWALAQRAAADLGSLAIDMKRTACTSPERVNEWIRYAMRHVVGSFSLRIPFVRIPYDDRFGIARPQPPIQLPGHGRATSIRMHLSHCKLQFPVAVAAKFEALTELSISKASFDEGEAALGRGCTLGDFVSSSCCPRLRKLEIISPRGMPQLVLRAEALEELLLSSREAIRTLDVTAPKLRVLRLQLCVQDQWRRNYVSYNTTIDVARVRAPALEEIGVYSSPYRRRPTLDICDLTSVRRLSDLHLDMHEQYCHRTDVALWLLENCPNVEYISVSLHHWVPYPFDGITTTTSMLIDLGLERLDNATPFARLTSIDLEACIFPRRHLVMSVSSFLMRCPRLRLLCIHLIDENPDGNRWRECICDDFDSGRSHKNLYLQYLEEF